MTLEARVPATQPPALRLAGRRSSDLWNTRAPFLYRKQNKIPDDLGTLSASVHGLRQHGRRLATGVAFTRNPADGTSERYGDFWSAPGQGCVAGIRNTEPISDLQDPGPRGGWQRLYHVFEILEDKTISDMMDLRVHRIQRASSGVLQTRVGKRTALSALKVAIRCTRRVASQETAVMRVAPRQLDGSCTWCDPKASMRSSPRPERLPKLLLPVPCRCSLPRPPRGLQGRPFDTISCVGDHAR